MGTQIYRQIVNKYSQLVFIQRKVQTKCVDKILPDTLLFGTYSGKIQTEL